MYYNVLFLIGKPRKLHNLDPFSLKFILLFIYLYRLFIMLNNATVLF